MVSIGFGASELVVEVAVGELRELVISEPVVEENGISSTGNGDEVGLSGIEHGEIGLGFFEDEEVLPGEVVEGLVVFETDMGQFFDGLGFGHFVKWFDGDVGVFASVFEKEEAAAGPEGFFDGEHHLVWV